MKNWSQKSDPHAKREAEKYEMPIPSREFIIAHLEKRGAPATHAVLCDELAMDTDHHIEALRRRLRAMERDGQLIWTRRKAYGLVAKMDLICGRVIGHRDGYGFLHLDDGSEDVYLTNRQMRAVFDGDRVVARIAGFDNKGRRDGVIVDVLERNTLQVVGRYFTESGVGFVAPDNRRINQDILIPLADSGSAKKGQYVVVDITVQPSVQNKAKGKVIEVLGDRMTPGMEIDVAIRSHSIPHVWPADVVKQIKKLPKKVHEKEIGERVDLRDLPFVTIDGEDAKDFDDAVYCEPRKQNGWRLFVAIADVSHYVSTESPLDVEASDRGNSVYFPDYVVPMLPEALSNDLCSLNPDVDRLCIVCQLTVSDQGKITNYQFYEGVIHSHARLTYTKVSQILENPKSDEGESLIQQYKPLHPHLKELYELYKALSKSRQKRGAIDFNTVETQILFGKDRKIEKIVPRERNVAHRIIEECMLCSNVAAARFLIKHELPGLYRVHESPSADKLSNLNKFLAEMSLSLANKKSPSSADYQAVLARAANRPDVNLIQTVMLRSMQQAVYATENKGHFGLSYPAYTHFTSPIRRYSDLLVHRAIRYIIRSRQESKWVLRIPGVKRLSRKTIYPYTLKSMSHFGEHCSMTERRADEAVRDVVDSLKCHFISDRIGETFDGIITSVTGFGLFVELADIYVEGLVHVTALDNDYYHFDAVKHRLTGEGTGMAYCLGDAIRVTVARVDVEDKNIDFVLATQKRNTKNSQQRKPAKKKGNYTKKIKPGSATNKKPRQPKKR